jgi:hypothetical protein
MSQTIASVLGEATVQELRQAIRGAPRSGPASIIVPTGVGTVPLARACACARGDGRPATRPIPPARGSPSSGVEPPRRRCPLCAMPTAATRAG